MMRSVARSCWGGEVQPAEVGGGVRVVQPPPHGVADRLRLLVNLLEHVVRVVALAGVVVAQVVADVLHPHVGGVHVLVADHPALAVQLADLAVVQVHHLVRVPGQGGRIRGEVVAVRPQADGQRATQPRADQHPRLVPAHHRQPVGALHQLDRFADGVQEVAVVVVGDQVRQHFGVGLAVELHPVGLQLVLQQHVVFDHAVVHHGDGAVAAQVRVGVGVGRPAVGGPAGVADAVGAGGGLRGHHLLQFGQPPGLPPQVQAAAGAGDEAGRVVPAVLQPLQPVEQDGRRFPRAGEPDDAAHARPSH